MSWEGIEFNDELSTPKRDWRPIPGDRVMVSKRSEGLNPMALNPLPRRIQHNVFSQILRPSEVVLATLRCRRVFVHERTEAKHEMAPATGDGPRSLLAVTRRRLLLFSLFLASPGGPASVALLGVEFERRYREFPLGHGELLSPLRWGEFTVTWRAGTRLVASTTRHKASTLPWRGPVRRFYGALRQSVGDYPFKELGGSST